MLFSGSRASGHRPAAGTLLRPAILTLSRNGPGEITRDLLQRDFWTASKFRAWSLLQMLVRISRSQYCPVRSLALRRADLSIAGASAKAAERERGWRLWFWRLGAWRGLVCEER